MDIRLLDSSLIALDMIDDFSSLLWVDRYNDYGDFELIIPINPDQPIIIKEDYYLQSKSSDHWMIIESLKINADKEEGDTLISVGRSLESILYRRIVWGQIIMNGNLQSEVHRLLNENAISPTPSYRSIPNLIFEDSVDSVITALTIKSQYIGDTLYDIIASICKAVNIGFQITVNNSNQFVFKLYSGQDRSYNQLINPYVVFSPNFDNIIQSDYVTSSAELKTVALVAGEGDGSDRLMISCSAPAGSGLGLARRELFVDASDISKTTASGTLTDPEYLDQLTQRGKEELAINSSLESFVGEVDSTIMFQYGVHFFMGDIVQVKNEYGQGGTSRITELIFSESISGTSIHPSFESIN